MAVIHFDIAALQYLRRQLDDYEALHMEQRPGCACWNCVLKLNADIVQHQARMRVKSPHQDGWF